MDYLLAEFNKDFNGYQLLQADSVQEALIVWDRIRTENETRVPSLDPSCG